MRKEQKSQEKKLEKKCKRYMKKKLKRFKKNLNSCNNRTTIKNISFKQLPLMILQVCQAIKMCQEILVGKTVKYQIHNKSFKR